MSEEINKITIEKLLLKSKNSEEVRHFLEYTLNTAIDGCMSTADFEPPYEDEFELLNVYVNKKIDLNIIKHMIEKLGINKKYEKVIVSRYDEKKENDFYSGTYVMRDKWHTDLYINNDFIEMLEEDWI